MYPDRETFGRMVQDDATLSAAGRETLLALYDGPLHLSQILEIVNAGKGSGADGVTKDRTITKSALRKRLEQLAERGILSKAGSECTNPFYYIRRPWIFNQYILVRCKDGPNAGLLDLTILLHELSQMAEHGDTALPHPKFISAVGERTERGHQITSAYEAFRKILGDKTAIGDYLEAIYEDIYEGKVKRLRRAPCPGLPAVRCHGSRRGTRGPVLLLVRGLLPYPQPVRRCPLFLPAGGPAGPGTGTQSLCDP
jgi:hypothetical protein